MNLVIGAPKIYGCVYDVSNFGQEHVYIAFEKMDKHLLDTTFREYIRQLKPIEKVTLFQNLFQALGYLWSLGYVHNDIKPENMMVSRDKSKLVIIDFGLVQERIEARNRNGSPKYMSPGKLRLNVKRYTEADDLYFLGLSISEILAIKLDYAFTDPDTKRPVSSSCYGVNNKPECQTQLRNAAIQILEPIFGPY